MTRAGDGRYVGGPLDGQPARRVRGAWPVWRTPDGAPVATRAGDRRFLGHHGHSGPEFYVCANDDGVYVHSAELVRRALAARGLR